MSQLTSGLELLVFKVDIFYFQNRRESMSSYNLSKRNNSILNNPVHFLNVFYGVNSVLYMGQPARLVSFVFWLQPAYVYVSCYSFIKTFIRMDMGLDKQILLSFIVFHFLYFVFIICFSFCLCFQYHLLSAIIILFMSRNLN